MERSACRRQNGAAATVGAAAPLGARIFLFGLQPEASKTTAKKTNDLTSSKEAAGSFVGNLSLTINNSCSRSSSNISSVSSVISGGGGGYVAGRLKAARRRKAKISFANANARLSNLVSVLATSLLIIVCRCQLVVQLLIGAVNCHAPSN